MSGLPQCVGAVDGCHIPILAPKENHCDYFNRKSFHSIILQVVVDQNRRYNDLFKYDMYIPVHTCVYIYIYIYIYALLHFGVVERSVKLVWVSFSNNGNAHNPCGSLSTLAPYRFTHSGCAHDSYCSTSCCH